MQILIEQKLIDFEFWCGGKDNAFLLTYEELNEIEALLEDMTENMMTDTQINDLFWFDFDLVCEWLGLSDKDIEERRNKQHIAS